MSYSGRSGDTSWHSIEKYAWASNLFEATKLHRLDKRR